MNKSLLFKAFRNTTGAVAYIFLVSQIMSHGDQLFGKGDNSFTPFAVLLLFSLSAAVVGGLIVGQSIFLFLENKKKESIKALIYAIGWLAMYTIIGMLILFIVK